jgi:hypothetical protein
LTVNYNVKYPPAREKDKDESSRLAARVCATFSVAVSVLSDKMARGKCRRRRREALADDNYLRVRQLLAVNHVKITGLFALLVVNHRAEPTGLPGSKRMTLLWACFFRKTRGQICMAVV